VAVVAVAMSSLTLVAATDKVAAVVAYVENALKKA
jgi:hypothetical protein